MNPTKTTTIILLGLALGACSDMERTDDTTLHFTEIESPAGAQSALPNLTRGPDGRVAMSWVEERGEGHVLRFARPTDPGFGPVRDVAVGDDWFVNWADFPSILDMGEGRMAAHWLQREGEGTYAYGVRVVHSSDGGDSWSAPVAPHTDGTLTEHGFVSLYPASGAVGTIWLDGRNMEADGHGTGHGTGHGGSRADGQPEDESGGGSLQGMTLRHARITPAGGREEERELDGLACDCCQTGVAQTDRGIVVVYRDRTEEEVRDISRLVRDSDGWSAPAPVHRDGWVIPGCPVNGPSVDAVGDRVAVAWFTAADGVSRVRLAFSANGGLNFDPPVTLVTDPEPMGRVDVVLAADGVATVSWLAEAGEDAERAASLLAQRVGAEGPMGEPTRLAGMSAARSSGFPRLEKLADDRLIVAWTEVSGDGADRSTRVRVGVVEPE